MSHLGDRLGLAPKARGGLVVRRQGLQDLDRRRPRQRVMPGLVDDAHGAPAHELLDLVGAQAGALSYRHDGRIMAAAAGPASLLWNPGAPPPARPAWSGPSPRACARPG